MSFLRSLSKYGKNQKKVSRISTRQYAELTLIKSEGPLVRDANGELKVWDIARRRPLTSARLHGAGAGVLGIVANSILGSTFLSQGRDGVVKGWQLTESTISSEPVLSLRTGSYHFCRLRIARDAATCPISGLGGGSSGGSSSRSTRGDEISRSAEASAPGDARCPGRTIQEPPGGVSNKFYSEQPDEPSKRAPPTGIAVATTRTTTKTTNDLADTSPDIKIAEKDCEVVSLGSLSATVDKWQLVDGPQGGGAGGNRAQADSSAGRTAGAENHSGPSQGRDSLRPRPSPQGGLSASLMGTRQGRSADVDGADGADAPRLVASAPGGDHSGALELSPLIALAGHMPSDVEVWDVRTCQVAHRLTMSPSSTDPGSVDAPSQHKPPQSGMCMALELFRTSQGAGAMNVVAGYEDGSVALWDLRRSTAPLASNRLHSEPVLSLALDSSCQGGVSGAADDRLVFFDLSCSEGTMTAREAPAGKPGIGAIAVRDDDKIAATGGWDHRVRVFDYQRRKPLATLACPMAAGAGD
eukprot:jgi/Mesen1/7086/ME000369S06411